MSHPLLIFKWYDHYCRPKLGFIEKQILEDVKRMMSEQIQVSSSSLSHQKKPNSHYISPDKPALIASCSSFGTKVFFFLGAGFFLVECPKTNLRFQPLVSFIRGGYHLVAGSRIGC